jgi:hypothetical protein
MADVNFLRFFSFFANTSLGLYKSGHVGEGLATLLFIFVQGEHRKYPSAWLLWTQEEKKQKIFRRRGTLSGVQNVKNSWWLTGWPAGTTPALECLGLAC